MAENRELALVLKLVADQFAGELKRQQGALGQFNDFITNWKTQLAAAGTALFAIAKTTANYGEELLKTSQKVGINVQALAGLQHAANLADLSDQQLAQGLKFLSVNMVEASRRTGDGEALFRRLGVAATDAAGNLRPTEAVLLELADAFAKSKDGAGKSEAAVKLFGKAGLDLIPFLNQGKAGITGLMQEAERLGLVLSKEDAEAANRFNDELKKMAAEARGMTYAVGKELIPVITDLIQLFRSFNIGSWFKTGVDMAREFGAEATAAFKALDAMLQLLDKHGLTLDEFRGRMDEINRERKQKIFDIDTNDIGIAKPLTGGLPPGTSGPQREIGATADFKGTGDAMAEEFKRLQDKYKADFQLFLQGLISMGRELTEAFSGTGDAMVKVFEDRRVQIHKEQDQLIENAQAWIAYHEQVGGSSEHRYEKEVDLIRASLAKQVELTNETAGELLLAWQEHESERAELILDQTALTAQQRETIELQSLTKLARAQEQHSNDFVAGWARGISRYTQQVGNGFNLATDMARRTAQAMEQGFRSFFFDVMDNRIKSFKDLMQSLFGFVKQIIAQVAAQLVTSGILNALKDKFGGSSIFSGLFGKGSGGAQGGEVVQRYALGGPVTGFGTRDTVPALLTPGEFVLSRADVAEIKRGAAGGVTVPITIVNQVPQAEVSVQRRPGGGKDELMILIAQAVNDGIARGRHDKALAQRFQLSPGGG